MMDIFVFEGIFGLKSRIFITAEFILRHESSPETCLKGSIFPSPAWIFICATAVVLPFRQQW
jgi:hypothetical protein